MRVHVAIDLHAIGLGGRGRGAVCFREVEAVVGDGQAVAGDGEGVGQADVVLVIGGERSEHSARELGALGMIERER